MSGEPQRRGADFWFPVAIIVALLAVRLLAVFRHEFDSDEAQHLHMVYGWLHGELPYRDRFDNHTPLLYLLFLPFAALAGETPQVVLLARLAEMPLGLGILGFVYLIARRLAGRQVALWTIALTLAFADWSLKSIEFRPDVLWAFCWFGALWLLVRQPDRPGAGRFFAIGLLLGAALCSSIKTTFLVPALGIGWAGAWIFSAAFRAAYPLRRTPLLVLSAGLGFTVAPIALFGWLIQRGTSLATLKFCLLGANQAPFEPLRVGFAVVLAPAALFLAWRIARHRPTFLAGLTAAVFLAVATYLLALAGFSPELRKQTFLVAWPLVLLLLVWAGAALLRPWRPALITPAAGVACAILLVHFTIESTLWNDGLRAHRVLLADTLALTKPGDYVLDRKGETIFRKRPVNIVYQHATLRGFDEGRLTEPPVSRLVETGTAAALTDSGGFPEKMRAYLKKNFLPVGDGLLRVPGLLLKPTVENGRSTAHPSVAQPGEYMILADQTPPRRIGISKAGPQTIELGANAPRRLLLIWKPAWDAGFPPAPKAMELLRSKPSRAAE